MYHLYKYVPRCRRCGSYKTGMLIHGDTDREWAIKRALRRGYHISYTSGDTYEGNNCYCLDCNVEWQGEIVYKLLNSEEFEEQKALRGISKAYSNACEYFDTINDNYIATKKATKKSKFDKLKKSIKKIYFGV